MTQTKHWYESNVDERKNMQKREIRIYPLHAVDRFLFLFFFAYFSFIHFIFPYILKYIQKVNGIHRCKLHMQPYYCLFIGFANMIAFHCICIPMGTSLDESPYRTNQFQNETKHSEEKTVNTERHKKCVWFALCDVFLWSGNEWF